MSMKAEQRKAMARVLTQIAKEMDHCDYATATILHHWAHVCLEAATTLVPPMAPARQWRFCHAKGHRGLVCYRHAGHAGDHRGSNKGFYGRPRVTWAP